MNVSMIEEDHAVFLDNSIEKVCFRSCSNVHVPCIHIELFCTENMFIVHEIAKVHKAGPDDDLMVGCMASGNAKRDIIVGEIFTLMEQILKIVRCDCQLTIAKRG